MAEEPIASLLVSDFTIAGLAPFLSLAGPGPPLACRVAPFDQVLPVLLDENHEARRDARVLVVWTRPQVIRSFAALLAGEAVETDAILAEVDAFAAALTGAAKSALAVLVPTWTLPSHERGQGPLSLTRSGAAYNLLRMNARLAETAGPNVHLVDASRWLSAVGANATSPKLWHLGKIAFTPAVFELAARDLKAAVRAVQGRARKLLVLDLDDTLWGGVVGDAGWQNLKLGGHDPEGEAFKELQRQVLALARRGVVLAIASKNTEAVALEAIDRHPEMVLRREHFAAWRIDWKDKAENVAALAAELNLGLDAVVFVDDNPVERARVRAALPRVHVPEWPADKLLAARALAELDVFDAVALSAEDRQRTRMYVSERKRRELETVAQSAEEYLASLELVVQVEPLDVANLARATQLLNKTNQMNLRTRRLSEAELDAWAREPGHRVLAFRVSDRFDDYGLTGLASLRADGDVAFVEDYVLSCRVMGRGVEETLLHVLAAEARALGLATLVVERKPTEKNAPCRAFLDRSRFARAGEERFAWSLVEAYPAPAHLTVKRP